MRQLVLRSGSPTEIKVGTMIQLDSRPLLVKDVLPKGLKDFHVVFTNGAEREFAFDDEVSIVDESDLPRAISRELSPVERFLAQRREVLGN